MDLDVYGFGEIYKYVKRLDTRRTINNMGMFRMAMNGSKKDYTGYMKSISSWLPKAERESDKGTQKDFNKLVASGKV